MFFSNFQIFHVTNARFPRSISLKWKEMHVENLIPMATTMLFSNISRYECMISAFYFLKIERNARWKSNDITPTPKNVLVGFLGFVRSIIFRKSITRHIWILLNDRRVRNHSNRTISMDLNDFIILWGELRVTLESLGVVLGKFWVTLELFYHMGVSLGDRWVILRYILEIWCVQMGAWRSRVRFGVWPLAYFEGSRGPRLF